MSAFPNSYAKLAFAGYGESPASVIGRTDMERGVAKQRRFQADAIVTVPVNVYFTSAANAALFESWVFGDLNGGGDWFDWTDPRTGTLRQARIVGGDIGTLTPFTPRFGWLQRSFKIEYVRDATV